MDGENIRVTGTLLGKPEGELTEAERAAVGEWRSTERRHADWLEDTNRRLAEECPILCSTVHSPVPSYGWRYPVERLCHMLEGLNVDMERWGLRVVLDQSKEKFGTLRFYTHTERREMGLVGLLVKPFQALARWINGFDFKMERVVDREATARLEWSELARERFDGGVDEFGNPFAARGRRVERISKRSDATETDDGIVYLVDEGGTCYRSHVVHQCAKVHYEPTRHRFMFWVRKRLSGLENFISSRAKVPWRQQAKLNELEARVDALVEAAEDGCYKVCQGCGVHFGTHVPRCETLGWTSFVCEDCAMVSNGYLKDGKTYDEGVEVNDGRM